MTDNLDFTIPADGASGPGWADDLQEALGKLDDASRITPASRGGVGDGIAYDKEPVQAALNAAGAAYVAGRQAVVDLLGRTWAVDDLVWPTGVTIVNGTLLLRPGADCPLISTTDFDDLVGTNSTGGVHDIGWDRLILDGNKEDQADDTDDLVRIYGFGFSGGTMVIRNARGRGLFTEWSNDAASPGFDSMEASIRTIKIHDCDGGGAYINGPHDSQIVDIIAYLNGENVQVEFGPKGNAIMVTHGHAWGLGSTISWLLGASGIQLKSVTGEGASDAAYKVMANDCHINGFAFDAGGGGRGLVIGDGSTAVAGLVADVTLLNFAGAIDWAGDVGGNRIRAHIYQTVAPEYIGTPDPNTVREISMAGRVGQESDFHFKGRASFPEGIDVTGNLTVETGADFQAKIRTSDPASRRARLGFQADSAITGPNPEGDTVAIAVDRNGDGGNDLVIRNSDAATDWLYCNEGGSVGIVGPIGIGGGLAFPGSAGAQTGWLDIYDPTGTTVVAKVPLHNPT